MYLVFGNPSNSFCQALQESLWAEGQQCHIVNSVFYTPEFAALRISPDYNEALYRHQSEDFPPESDIQGVYIHEFMYPDESAWKPDDYEYVCEEITSAFLAWLQALTCPVLNRYAPRTWYGRFSNLLAWRKSAFQAGLEISECFASSNSDGDHLQQIRFVRPTRL